MKKVLIDSDVVMDFLGKRQPFYADSVKILSLCELKKIQGFVTPVIVSNIYYLLRLVEKHENVIEKLKVLMSFLDILVIDKTTIIEALNSGFSDFEDALQNYAAEHSNSVSAIITRNSKDYKNSNLSVFTPTEFLKTL